MLQYCCHILLLLFTYAKLFPIKNLAASLQSQTNCSQYASYQHRNFNLRLRHRIALHLTDKAMLRFSLEMATLALLLTYLSIYFSIQYILFVALLLKFNPFILSLELHSIRLLQHVA